MKASFSAAYFIVVISIHFPFSYIVLDLPDPFLAAAAVTVFFFFAGDFGSFFCKSLRVFCSFVETSYCICQKVQTESSGCDFADCSQDDYSLNRVLNIYHSLQLFTLGSTLTVKHILVLGAMQTSIVPCGTSQCRKAGLLSILEQNSSQLSWNVCSRRQG